jgi:hypothetical protein
VRHILFRPGRRSDRGRPHQLVATADADVGMLLSHNPSPWGCRRWTTTSSSSVRVDGRIPGWPPPTTCWTSSPSFPSTRRMSRPPTCSPSSRHSGVPRQDARVIRLEDREHGLAVRTIKRRLASVWGLFASLVARGNAGVTANPVPRGQATRRAGPRQLQDRADLLRDAVHQLFRVTRFRHQPATRARPMPRHGTATCRRAAGGPSRVTRRQTRCYTGCANQPST